MRIAVVAPHTSNNGASVLTMLIGMKLASFGKPTCITHIKPTSNSFYTYLNFSGFQDKTSSPSQIVKVLREGSLNNDEARDYCKQITPDLEAFTNNAPNFDQEDMIFMFKYIAKAFPHENVIFDVDNDDPEQVKTVVSLCDVVVLNVTQSVTEMNSFKADKEKYQDMFKGKPLVVVVNKYHSTKGTLAETAKWMGVKKPNNWVVLHDNPWITWATNHGNLNQLYRKIEGKDPRVIELNSDLTKICTTLARAKTAGDKKGGGRK